MNTYKNMEIEELLFLLDFPEEIETGCENPMCDICKGEAIKEIKNELKSRDMHWYIHS